MKPSTNPARRNLDQRFRNIGGVDRFQPPAHGWIKAIRTALGLTTAQLAKRLRISQPSVIALEQSEAKNTIELASLQRVAAALDCTLIYALVPNKPLETIVRDKARDFARRRYETVEHSMLLEDQSVARRNFENQLDEIVRNTNPRRFWD